MNAVEIRAMFGVNLKDRMRNNVTTELCGVKDDVVTSQFKNWRACASMVWLHGKIEC